MLPKLPTTKLLLAALLFPGMAKSEPANVYAADPSGIRAALLVAIPLSAPGIDFSAYPKTRSFTYFVSAQIDPDFHPGQLLALSAYPAENVASYCVIAEDGRQITSTERLNFASVGRQIKQHPSWDTKALRLLLPELPSASATPPLSRLLLISFRDGKNWTTRAYDTAALPEPLQKICHLIGPPFEPPPGGTTAAAANANSPLPFRTFNKKDEATIVSYLKKAPRLPISIQYEKGNKEAAQFSQAIATLLHQSGLENKCTGVTIPNFPPNVSIMDGIKTNESHSLEYLLHTGISFSGERSAILPAADINGVMTILVGPRN